MVDPEPDAATGREEVLLRTNGYRLASIVVLLAGAVLFATGQTTPVFRIIAATFLFLAIRGYRLALVVSNGNVKIRGWLYSRAIPLSSIESVEVGPYAGAWSRGSSLYWVDMLVLVRVNRSRIPVSAVIGLHSKGRVDAIARRFEVLLAADRADPR
jgi:hypothetical protein